jgi:hypothetical protein
MLLITIAFVACRKDDDSPNDHHKQTNAYSSQVVVKWLDQQLKLGVWCCTIS